MAKAKLMSERKRRICELDAESIAFYRRNPCIACEELLGIKLIDSQKYILQASWNKPHVLWCCSRNFGKSFIGAVFMILKAILYENQAIYIVSSVGDQAKETFTKIEEIVTRLGKTAASIRSLKDIAEKETVKSPTNKTGFSHNPAGFEVSFYNGSTIITLNSKPDNVRGKFIFLFFIIENKSNKEEIIMKRWTKEEIAFLEQNYSKLSPDKLALHFNRSKGSVIAKAHDLKLTNNGEWSYEEIDFLKSNYNIMTNKEIASCLTGRSKTAIDMKASKLGLKKDDIYTYDRTYFDNIDTKDKAYWLGFFFADGYVCIINDRYGYECGITLAIIDYEHLKKFNKCINGNIKIYKNSRMCSLNNKMQEYCSIRCYSKNMVNGLISNGCVENKTFTMRFPNIKDELKSHFIRGYFDGDGCICKNSNTRNDLQINFCSASEEFLIDIRKELYKNGIKSYIVNEKEKTTYRLYIKGIYNVDNMWNYMFKDATVYLDRKLIKKENLYKEFNIAHRLPRLSEMAS